MNLGNINFGINAQITGLNAAVTQLNSLRTAAAQVAQGMTTASKQAVEQVERQVSALESAINRVKQLGAEANRTSQGRSLFQDLASGLNDYGQALNNTSMSSTQFIAAQRQFGTVMSNFRVGMQDIAHQGDAFNNFMRSLGASAVFMLGPLSGIGSRIGAFIALMGRVGPVMAIATAALSAFSLSMFEIIRKAAEVGLQMTQLTRQFEAATGSIDGARDSLRFVHDLSNRLGLSFTETAASFANLSAAARGTAFQGNAIRSIFEAIAATGARLGLSNERVQRAFLAVEQMMSKGTVQSQELRIQLGQALPGAMDIAARAMGVTQGALARLMQQGLLTTDFLPRFARELLNTFNVHTNQQIDTYQASLERVKNAFFDLFNAINNTFGITEALRRSNEVLAASLEFVATHLLDISKIAVTVGAALLGAFAGPAVLMGLRTLVVSMAAVAASMANLGIMGIAFEFIAWAQGIMTAVRSLNLLNIALALIPGEKLVEVLLRIAGAVIAASAAWFGMSALIDNATASQLRQVDSIDQYIQMQRRAQQTDRDILNANVEAARERIFVSNRMMQFYQDQQRELQRLLNTAAEAHAVNPLRSYDMLGEIRIRQLENQVSATQRLIDEQRELNQHGESQLRQLLSIRDALDEAARHAVHMHDALGTIDLSHLEQVMTAIREVDYLQERVAARARGASASELRDLQGVHDAMDMMARIPNNQIANLQRLLSTVSTTHPGDTALQALSRLLMTRDRLQHQDQDDHTAQNASDRAARITEAYRDITQAITDAHHAFELINMPEEARQNQQAIQKEREEIDRFSDRLQRLHVPAAAAAEQIRNLTQALDQLRVAQEDQRLDTQMATTVEALQAGRLRTEAMHREALATQGTNRQLEEFRHKMDLINQLDAYANALTQAGADSETVARSTADMSKAMEELYHSQQDLQNGLRGFTTDVEGAFHDALVKVIDDISNMQFGLKTLADVGKLVAQELTKAFLTLALLNPLENSIFGSNLPTIFGQGKGIPGIPGLPLPGGGGPTKVLPKGAKGMLIGPQQPTLLGGGSAIGGEAGEEALLPVIRTANGDAGVKAIGAGMTFNMHVHGVQDMNGFRKSQNQIGMAMTKMIQQAQRNA